MKKIKICFICFIIFVICFGIYNKFDEDRQQVDKLLSKFLDNDNYVSYYMLISSNHNRFTDTLNKDIIYEFLNYLISLESVKYSDIPKDKVNELDDTYAITILAEDSKNNSNMIGITVSYSNLFELKDYNNNNRKYYYVKQGINVNIIKNLIEKCRLSEK